MTISKPLLSCLEMNGIGFNLSVGDFLYPRREILSRNLRLLASAQEILSE
jgi:hypothetical protein